VETNNKPLMGVPRAREVPLEAAKKGTANKPINMWAIGKGKKIEDWLPQKNGIKQQPQGGGFIAKIFDNKKQQQDDVIRPETRDLKARHWDGPKLNAEMQPIIKETPVSEAEKTQAPTQGTSSYSSSSWNPSRSNLSSSSFGDSSRSNLSSSSFGDSSRSNLSSSFEDSSRSNQRSSSFGDYSRSNQQSNPGNPYQSSAGTSGYTQFHTTTQTPRRKH